MKHLAPARHSFVLPAGLGLLVVIVTLMLSLRVGQAQVDPGPEEDRVGFPEGYQENFKLLYAFDRFDNRQVRVVYGNEQAASVKRDEPFPYGSIIAMETRRAEVDPITGQVLLDEEGRYRPGELTAIFVSRKEQGFGEAYQHNRNGEWEYVAYRPDGTYLTPPPQSASCARCHLQAGPTKDWQFRISLYVNAASGAVPTGVMQHYVFSPNVLGAKAGETVTWYNDDEVAHRIAVAGSDSGEMPQGASFRQRFPEAGKFIFRCLIHPAMQGVVYVYPE
jgi:plastocyanin